MGLRWRNHALNVEFKLSDYILTLHKVPVSNIYERMCVLEIDVLASNITFAALLPLELHKVRAITIA